MKTIRLLALGLLLAPLLAVSAPTGAVTITPAAADSIVNMEFYGFVDQGTLSPVTNIAVGDTVTWINVSPGTPISAPHTATHGAQALVDGTIGGEFDSDVVASGGSFSNTFGSAGSFAYYCKLHPWMRGVVVVS